MQLKVSDFMRNCESLTVVMMKRIHADNGSAILDEYKTREFIVPDDAHSVRLQDIFSTGTGAWLIFRLPSSLLARASTARLDKYDITFFL